jgi:PAS domain S-box-containing protein
MATCGSPENDFELMVECAPDAIYIADGQRFIFVNNAFVRMMGATSRDQLTGSLVFARIHPAYHALIHERVDLIHVEEKSSGLKDVVYLKMDGTPVDVESSAVPFHFHGISAAMVILRDITVRKRAEEELQRVYGELEKRVIERTAELNKTQEAYRKANEKLNLLSSITRHDINNQLLVLRSYLAFLEKEQLPPTLTEYLKRAETASQNISVMIQFTKEYENVGVNAPVWQNCRTLIETAVKQISLGNLLVKNDVPEYVEVLGDPLIIKVFYNLTDNAIRYGGKITTIHFSMQESDDTCQILCEDDGDGIAVEDKDKIFERGFGKNTGLGLYLSREILEITSIKIRETGETGNGARFEMTVPKESYRSTKSETE